MAKSTYAQTNFSWGELSPRAYGRFDMAQFYNGSKLMENFLGYQLGGAMFRPGTIYLAETKNSLKKSILIPFQFSTTQNYIIETGDLYMRFFSNRAQVIKQDADVSAWVTGTLYAVGNYVKESSVIYYCVVGHTAGTFATDLAAGKWIIMSIYELPTPYDQADIVTLHYAQNADTMYIVHPSYAPRKLQRTNANTFTLAEVSFVRGPFLDKNITTTTITASADVGVAITLTASVAIFNVNHIGSLWRVKSGVVKITAFTSSTVVTGTVQAEPDGTTGNLATTGAGVTDWAEGAFSKHRGYPSTCAFHEDRLYYASTPYEPQTLYGSVIGAYDDFEIGTDDDNSVIFNIATEQVNAIRWLSSSAKSMQIGTSGGTFSASSGSTDKPITATNITVHRDSTYGSANIMPKRISSYLYYVQRNLFQMRELSYNVYVDTQIASDMNILADHVLRDGAGVISIDHQQSPNDRLWCVRSDGQIAILTRNAEQQVISWCRFIGGTDAKGPGLFESVAIIPQENNDDEVYAIVNRNINGTQKRYIEYFTQENFDNDWDAVRSDSSLTYDIPKVVSGATKTNPVVISSTSHGFSAGDQIKIDNIVGMTELNGNFYLVKNITTHTFEITDLDGNNVNGLLFSTYKSSGQARKMITTVSGLSHLEGETVSIQVDGGVPSGQQTFVVSSGSITLKQKAAVVHVGLPYTGTIQMLKLSDGSQVGQTKSRRIYLSTLRIYRSLGVLIGMDESHLNRIYFHAPNDPVAESVPLFTGDSEKHFDTWWSREAEILIRQDQPLPLMILAVVLRSDVQE